MEGVPGQEAEVWVQDKGGGALRLRGHVVIEDLTGVLTAITSRSGANGPQNPVTQYMLARAASHLTDRLTGDMPLPRGHQESVPRILSTALGHQPFIETVLGMSQHQMLRRWPLATAWYTDVINYMLRAGRFLPTFEQVAASASGWAQGTFGDFVRRFGANALDSLSSQKQVRVAEALQILWPDFAPVHQAMAAYRVDLGALWAPIYEAALRSYGLVVRPGVGMVEMTWAMNALNSRETLERVSGFGETHADSAGREWTLTAWASLVLVAGACTDEQGRPLSPEQLISRTPVRPFVVDNLADNGEATA